MGYDIDIGLARTVSKALRQAGLKVYRKVDEWELTATDDAGASVCIECEKESETGHRAANIWLPPPMREDARAYELGKTIAAMLREAGLSVTGPSRF